MSSENGQGHEHDTHYHGEPSRVLDDRSLPESVVLYDFVSVDGEAGESLEWWFDELAAVEEISRVYVSDKVNRNDQSLDFEMTSRSELQLLSSDFDGFSRKLMDENSLLFLPTTLRISSDAWEDLRANDVSVNWLSVDTKNTDDLNLPKLIVLSDWITEVDSDLPAERATGVSPGIFHLNSDSLQRFSNLAEQYGSLEGILNDYLDDPGSKIRPGFLHNRDWHFASR